jgi:hypothetical protein
MPFIMQHMLHIPPWSIWQRFCIMAQAAVSVQLQVIFMPPWHFSTLKVQRGTITMFGDIPPVPVMGIPPMVGVAIPAMPIVARSIIVPFIVVTPWVNIPGSAAAPFEDRPAVRLPPDPEKPTGLALRGCFSAAPRYNFFRKL